MIYFVVVFLMLILIFRYDINERERGRDQCYCIILIIMILIAGLRWRLGADTTTYLYNFYHRTPTLHNFRFDEMTIGMNPFWSFFNSIILTIGGKFYVVQLLHATFINYLIFRYFKKHTKYIFTCAFFYFIWRYFNMNMQEMKASISVVLCLYGNDYFLEKKWIKGYGLFLLGCLFHFSTLLLIITPLFFFLRFNAKGYLILALSFFMGFMIQSSFGDYLLFLDFDDRIEAKAETYMEGAENSTVDLFRMSLTLIPPIIYTIISAIYLRKQKENETVLKFEPFVVLSVIFNLISISIPIFYRYFHFYAIYAILFISTFTIKYFKRETNLPLSTNILHTAILFFPLLLSISTYFIKSNNYKMYYPYSSIFNRKVDKEREDRFNVKLIRPVPDYNEY